MNKIKNNEIDLPKPKPKKIKKKGGASVMSLRMAGKWARFARLYLEKQATSLNYRIKWINFANRLLRNQTKDMSRGGGVKQMKNKVINSNTKTR